VETLLERADSDGSFLESSPFSSDLLGQEKPPALKRGDKIHSLDDTFPGHGNNRLKSISKKKPRSRGTQSLMVNRQIGGRSLMEMICPQPCG